MDSRRVKGTTHYVFEDKKEFEEWFMLERGVVPPLVDDWRLAQQGDWTVADDGGVVQVLKWGPLPHPHDRKNYKSRNGYVRTIVGAFIQDERTYMDCDFSKHPNRFRFNSATDKDYLKRRKERSNLSNPEVMFAAGLAAGKSIQSAYEDSFGPHHDWRNRALFLLKRERIMSKIKENAKEKLDETFNGSVLGFIFDQLKELVLSSDNDRVKLDVLKELAEWSGEKEKDKVKQITQGQVTVFKPFEQDELTKIEAEEVKILSESDES
jgi:hypothetical protein